MFRVKLINLFVMLTIVLYAQHASAVVTPSDVYSRVKALESVIKKISASKRQRIETIKLLDAKPLHVYAIATALNEKIIILNGMDKKDQILRPEFPNRDITPAQVLSLILAIEHNLKVLNPSSKFHQEPSNNRHPKDVLRLLVRCNLLIDSMLVNNILPQYPYQVVQQINQLLLQGITANNKILSNISYPLYLNAKPVDVFVHVKNMFSSLMSAAHLKYDIDYPQRPYYRPYNERDIKPIHVFTVTVMNRVLLQDFMRRHHSKVNSSLNFKLMKSMAPANVYQQYEKALLLLQVYLSQP